MAQATRLLASKLRADLDQVHAGTLFHHLGADGLTLRITYDDGSTESRLLIADPKRPQDRDLARRRVVYAMTAAADTDHCNSIPAFFTTLTYLAIIVNAAGAAKAWRPAPIFLVMQGLHRG